MWDIILENKKGRATILTTHSMEEADALCSRIAIMVKGELKCIGTSQVRTLFLFLLFFSFFLFFFFFFSFFLFFFFSSFFYLKKNKTKQNKNKMNKIQGLKEKFGDGYVLDIKSSPSKVTEVKELVKENFPQSILVEEYGARMQFKIPSVQIKLSEVFQIFENSRQSLSVEDYSFSQTTLEQVFISFAKMQN